MMYHVKVDVAVSSITCIVRMYMKGLFGVYILKGHANKFPKDTVKEAKIEVLY